MDRATIEIIPKLLYARPGPSTAPWSLQELRGAGLRVVVSLADNVVTSDFTKAGLKHYEFRFDDSFRRMNAKKRDGLLALYLKIERTVGPHLDGKEPTLIHCRAGKDRTGFICALLLARRTGLRVERAIDRMRKLRPEFLTSGGAEEFTQMAYRRLKRRARLG